MGHVQAGRPVTHDEGFTPSGDHGTQGMRTTMEVNTVITAATVNSVFLWVR